MTKRWIKLCDIKELEDNEIHAFDIENRHIIAFIKDRRVHALDGYCTHEEADLKDGFLLEDVIICPLHLSQFNIFTGEVVNPPAEKPLKVYNIKLENSTIYIELD
ncbi:MAG: non-heme iron oxygenase ferredoxin subunit [Thermoproteota archaeon]|jgi:Ferredoxin subunits of nitrite reductase and ring-hydroxylating dioxygenases